MIPEKTNEKILVMRFSALGDVAMTVPVLKLFLALHPTKELFILSNQQFSDLFLGINRLHFIGADLTNTHKGIIGIFRLYKILKKQYEFSMVADLHGVLRSHLLRFLLRMNGKKTAVIDKGRNEKYALIRKSSKIFRPLTHSTDRYINVFEDLGYILPSLNDSIIESKNLSNHNTNNTINIGFAPFAKHDAKMYELDKFKEIVKYFDKDPYNLFFFGGGGAEKRILEDWEKQLKNVIAVPKGVGLRHELEIMKKLNVMITMDSANMHLASLANIPVISIWGATHPYAGFYGYNQNPLHAVQVHLSCRPCSVFGNKECWRGDYACMKQISPEMVIKKVEQLVFIV